MTFGLPCYLFVGLPPQQNCPSPAVPEGKRYKTIKVVLHFRLSCRRSNKHDVSYLRYVYHLNTATRDCSKVPGVFLTLWKSLAFAPGRWFRGFPDRDSGNLITSFTSQQSIGNGLCLLKKVTVTSAANRSLYPLEQIFGYQCWADVADCTKDCSLAVSYAFSKQLDSPSHCALIPLLRPDQGSFLANLQD